MRRIEKEISEIHEIEAILNKAQVCRLGLAVENVPYIVPMFFGYKDHCLYLHCAKEGRKLEMIRRNNIVCFEMTTEISLLKKENLPCQWSSTYSSVIGYGEAFIIENFEEKKHALDVIMNHYDGETAFEYLTNAVSNVTIIKVVIREMSGKRSN